MCFQMKSNFAQNRLRDDCKQVVVYYDEDGDDGVVVCTQLLINDILEAYRLTIILIVHCLK